MNITQVIMFKLLRTYSTKRRIKSTSVREKIKITKTDFKEFENNFNECDPDDTEMFESNLSNIAESYVDYKRNELKTKEQLKQYIVQRKFFKEVEPSFITYAEKDQIKKLHQENPEEWTLEKLSQSFPALPQTIKKILKAKWTPKSAEKILEYDRKVIENWKKLKTGQLAVNPILKEHLMKFKDRKIGLIDIKTLTEKFIPPKIEFSEPKSTFFSSIVKNPFEEKAVIKEQISSQENIVKQIGEENYNITKNKDTRLVIKEANDLIERKAHKVAKVNKNNDQLVFEEFLKKKLNDSDETCPEEKLVLKETYKKYVESKNFEDLSLNISNNTTKDSAIEEKNLDIIGNVSNRNALDVRKNTTEFKEVTKTNTIQASLETYIKERNSCIDTQLHYMNRIKIPKNVYKQGMTYRIKDCYYDDNGEFLYKVPGLKG